MYHQVLSQISVEHLHYYQSDKQEKKICFLLSLDELTQNGTIKVILSNIFEAFFEIKVTAFLIIRVFARWSTDHIKY